MTLSPGVRLGPYEILAMLGAGGMGEVYRAKDTRLGRTVAIKILPQHVLDHPARRQRFEREARAASRLSHPHICALYDVGEHDGIHFIVMEHLEGQTLAERLRRGPMPITQVLRCGIEIADALDHAHRAGIVHRDLKPANVMLTPAGAKLLDFGVARLTGADGTDADVSSFAETEPLTGDGVIPGTLHYMAPEQLEGKHADARTDIFAFGTVVYEMTTARRAFDGASRASLIARILEHDPPALSTAGEPGAAPGETLVPPALDHVVSRCLAKDPDQRWQTAADLRQELRWIAGSPSQIQTAGQRRVMRRRPGRALAWLAAASVALAATAYVAATSWMAEPSQPVFRQLTFRRGVITEARFLPDGQTVLYSAAWDGGPMQLYETRPGRPESSPREAPMTGLASVSSNELALLMGCRLEYGFCVGTLATKPLSGGAPRELAGDVVAADWSPDGARLAAIRRTGGEYRVEYPVGSRTLHRTTGRLNHLRFAPGDERLAFMEFPVLDEEIGSLKVIGLDGRVDTLTTGWRSIRGLQWSPRGDEIWFTGSRNGKACSLYAVSLSGTVRLILHAPGDVTLSDISRDGRRVLLTYGPVRARMIWSDGEGERDLSWFDWPTVADLSTDGTTVLFHEWGEATGATPVMYTRRVDRADAVKLGDGKALALSPDGRWALGLVDKDRPQLVLHPTGAGSSRVLTIEDVTDVYLARWFPDSRRILVTGLVDEGAQVFILDIENAARPQRIADIGTIGLLAHPDGRRILGVDPLGDHFLWPVDGGEPVPVAGLGSEDTPFQWSADARFLYLRGHDDDALRVYRYDLATGRRDPWRTLAPRDPAGLMGVSTGRGEVAITPDGRGMVFNYWTWLGDLFLIEGVR